MLIDVDAIAESVFDGTNVSAIGFVKGAGVAGTTWGREVGNVSKR
jgi:hypothetical protein